MITALVLAISTSTSSHQRRMGENSDDDSVVFLSKEKAINKATTDDIDTDTDTNTDTNTDLLLKKAIQDAHDYMLSKYGQAYVDEHNNTIIREKLLLWYKK